MKITKKDMKETLHYYNNVLEFYLDLALKKYKKKDLLEIGPSGLMHACIEIMHDNGEFGRNDEENEE